MPTITDEQLKELLQNIPDDGIRAHLEMITSGQIKAEVFCLKAKKPVKMGEQMMNDAWIGTGRPGAKHNLISYRQRFDGLTGFACACGNRSIVAPAEEGHIGGMIPSREDLAAIHGRLEKFKSEVRGSGGAYAYDGFQIVSAVMRVN